MYGSTFLLSSLHAPILVGPVMMALDPPETLPHSLEPQLRSLGMPTELKRGVPTLVEPFVVCKKGEKLSAQKAQILKHLLIKDAKFRLIPLAYWTEDICETRDYPLSVADEETVSELKKQMLKPEKSKIRNSARTAAAIIKKKLANQVDMDEDDDDDDDEDDKEMDSEEEFDEAAVGDKVTKRMMLPSGL